MKKNKIFLWAYITAICISVIVRLCVEYSQWRAIVLGITVSSAFFAIEDLFSSLCRTLHDSCDLLEQYAMKSKRYSQRDREFFEQLQEKVISQDREEEKNSDIIEAHESTIALIDELISNLDLLENKVKESRKRLVSYEKYANCITYLGYLFLFCAVFFSDFIDLPNLVLEVLTVLSFAVIMVTQQLNQHFSEEIKKEAEVYQTELEAQEEELKKHPEFEKHIYELLSTQKRLSDNEEEIKRLTEEIERLEALEHAD